MPKITTASQENVSTNLQAEHAVAVTASDSTVFSVPSTLYIGVAGDVAVVTAGGETVTYPSVPNGFFPVLVTSVKSTGTTATGIVRQY